ncbi:MAG: DUF3987 domain-containing protein [Prevotella sp.]|nr:DUF3987 domain-containing protein [Prevotella sp.]
MEMNQQQKYFTCIGKGHGAPCFPANREDWEKLRREPWLAQMCARIEKGDDELKHRLPVWTPHCAEFANNHRAIADAVRPLNRLMLDFDEKGHTGDILSKLEMRNEKGEMVVAPEVSGMKILLVEESVRRGTHVLVELPEGMTAEQAQELMKEATGFTPDAAVKDVSRCIYMVTEEHTKYVSDKLFSIDHSPLTIEHSSVPVNEAANNGQCSMFNVQWPSEFKGIPYTSIIAEWWHRNGGEPAEGERNVKLHKLAVNLRAICDNKKDVLMQVMPRFGLSDVELRSVVDSACKEPPKGISKMMQGIVDALEMGISSDEIEDAEAVQAETGVKVNVRTLPIGLKESLTGVPVSMHMPVLCGVMPIAAAYADQVQIEYCDGNLQHLGLMSIIRGEQASNKSVVKNAIDVWKRQFDEEDALARKREEEWKERKKGRKANEKAPEDPKVLIRMVPVTVSCSTLLKRFKNANGHCIYSFGEELDTLRKTNGAGSWSSKYDIYRLSFDQGEWGQDYNSDQAESGVVKVAYNWTMLGTNGAMRKCFKSDNIENGLSSRILVAEMPDSSFSKMPKFGRRSAEDEARIQQAVTRLRAFSGLIDTPRLRKAIEEWVEQKRVEAAKDIDRVKDTYRKRAAVIGFRCGVIFHLLSDAKKESKACLDFALMMAEYCLSQQMKAFGEALRNEYVSAQDECQRYGANHSVFDQLAPTFSRDDLRVLKSGTTESGLRNIVMRWKRDGWIVPIDKHHWSKTSQCPIVPASH